MTGNAKQNLAKRSTSENSNIFQNTHQSHHSDRENHINQSEIFIKTCYTQANEYNQKAKNSSRDITEEMDFFFNKEQNQGTLKGRYELNENIRTLQMFKNLNSLKKIWDKSF